MRKPALLLFRVRTEMFSKLEGDDGTEEDGSCHYSDSVSTCGCSDFLLVEMWILGLSPRSLDPGPLGSKGESR